MKILLDKEEVLKIIWSALCNGGLSMLYRCEVELAVTEEDYTEAKQALIDGGKDAGGICREDVWAQILRGGKALQFYDNDSQEKQEFDLEKATKELCKEEAADTVMTYHNEEDDAITAAAALEHCLYGKVIFG